MIKIRENPEKNKGINKFIDSKTHEGLRGKILAIHISGKKAIILATNQTCDNKSVLWGKLYLIEEFDPNKYPITKAKVDEIPNNKQWRMVLDD